jgi:multicomponent Na+:H+ antiporter subunit B
VSRGVRLGFFGAAVTGLAAVLVVAVCGLPHFGDAHEIVGRVIDGVGVPRRHATDLVTALNFDIRGFDTLGEEFILFGSVLAVVLVLRQLRPEHAPPRGTEGDEHEFEGASEALRGLALVMVPVLIALGGYVVVHCQLTPGGGFQGGIVLAAAPLAVFLSGRFLRFQRIAPDRLVEVAEALGAAGYGLVGLSGLVIVGVFFKNALPLGTAGRLLSAGQIDVASVAVGLEVSGAFLVAWSEFLDQALLVKGEA